MNHDIEQALSAFAAGAPRIDRDELMYQAGFQAAHADRVGRAGGRRQWQGATALLAAASVAMAIALWRQPVALPTAPPSRAALPEQVAAAGPQEPINDPAGSPLPEPAADPPLNPLLRADPNSNYLALRAVVLQQGVDAWPTPDRAAAAPLAPPRQTSPLTVRSKLEDLFPPLAPPEEPVGEDSAKISDLDEDSIA